jgi:uncharacterized membrane protein YedE/YeeE
MDYTTLSTPLAGGALIGLAAASLLAFRGKIAGISGIVGGLLDPTLRDTSWRLLFLAGLAVGGISALALWPGAFAQTLDRSVTAVAVAGLLVGVGTRLGNGCTSGHGVCGTSRLSPRSIAATATFLAAGAVTVLVMNLFGGTS